jgi:hypothetical protein
MKVYVQTTLTPQMKVYDTSTPTDASSEDSGIGKTIRNMLKPVVQVTDDNDTILYKSGDFYEPVVSYILLGLFGIAAGYGLIRLVRKFI